jgi:hypothetical protein
MCRDKIDKRLSDKALERIMQDVLYDMGVSIRRLAAPVQVRTRPCGLTAQTATQSLPRITSLRLEDLFGSIDELDKPT